MTDLMPAQFIALFAVLVLLIVVVALFIADKVCAAYESMNRLFDQIEKHPFPIELGKGCESSGCNAPQSECMGVCSMCVKNQPGDKCEPNRND